LVSQIGSRANICVLIVTTFVSRGAVSRYAMDDLWPTFMSATKHKQR